MSLIIKSGKIPSALVLCFVKIKNKKGLFLLKAIRPFKEPLKKKSIVLKALPCLNNNVSLFSTLNISKNALNYTFALRYLYCFGTNFAKNL